MATAYVSPVGSAAYPGTVGAPTSLTTALSSAGVGDTVYLAPGNYRGTFTVGVSGTAGSTIQFIGDPLASQAIGGITAGVVRITNYISDTVYPTIATLLTATSRSYFSFANIYFESHHNSAGILGSLVTCTNWSFEKCIFVSNYSQGFSITTTANVALNASFTKCIFYISAYATALNCPNHASSYSLNFNMVNCTSNFSLVLSYAGTPGTSTNAGGITIYNCYSQAGTCVQLYQSTTTHPSYVYNSLLISNGNALISSTSGALIENYNVVRGGTFAITAGANSSYIGIVGLDYGYSAIVGLPAPSINGPYIGSRLLGAGTAIGAPATDADGVAWYQSLLGIGAYTYAGRNNVITFPVTPTPNTITIASGSTSQSIEIYLGATGLTVSTSGLSAYYNRTRTAAINIPLITRTISQAWTAGGLAEVDAVNMPGIYRFDIPNDALNAGADDVTVVVKGLSTTVGAVVTIRLQSVVNDILSADLGSGTNAGTLNERTVRSALRSLRNKVAVASGTMTVYKENDADTAWTGSLSNTSDVTVDPS
jgi:hypothetical protein